MSANDEDDDGLLEALENETENDPSLAHLREARIQQLSSEINRAKALRNDGYGSYSEVKDEKQLLDITTSQKLCIVHFSKSDFNRCRIMDGHLKNLAEQHLEARFCKMDVENAPFLVTKLGVKVLPCVICFVGGISVDRIIGFESLGSGVGMDSFETAELEDRLLNSGVLNDSFGRLTERRGQSNGQHSEAVNSREEDVDDDEWD